jgi:hypothetical protein
MLNIEGFMAIKFLQLVPGLSARLAWSERKAGLV